MENFDDNMGRIKFVRRIFFILIGWSGVQSVQIPTTYLSERCVGGAGVTVHTNTHGRVETSNALWYEHNADCVLTISVDSGRRVLLLFNRFELEDEFGGVCVDFLNIHDGSSVASPTLNVSPLCGELVLGNLTSSTSAVTLHFSSDDSITRRGFDVVFVAVEDAPCPTAGWFQCGTGMCINNELRCNGYSECPDASDESTTTCKQPDGGSGVDVTLAITLGVSLGGGALLLLALLAVYRGVEEYRWRRWVARHGAEDGNPWAEEEKALQYPVTDRYVNYEFHLGRKLGRRNDAFWDREDLPHRTPSYRSVKTPSYFNMREEILEEDNNTEAVRVHAATPVCQEVGLPGAVTPAAVDTVSTSDVNDARTSRPASAESSRLLQPAIDSEPPVQSSIPELAALQLSVPQPVVSEPDAEAVPESPALQTVDLDSVIE